MAEEKSKLKKAGKKVSNKVNDITTAPEGSVIWLFRRLIEIMVVGVKGLVVMVSSMQKSVTKNKNNERRE